MESRAITRAVKKNGNEGKTMFDLTITHEVNELLKQVRADLKNKGYKRNTSRCNRYIGSLHLNYITEFFIKGSLLFEIEKDLNNNTITATLYYNGKNGREEREIRLTDILSLA